MEQYKIINHVANRIKMLRNERHFTLNDVAGKIGVSRKQIQNYENASCNIPVGRLCQLAECLNVDLNYFTRGLKGLSRSPDDDYEFAHLFNRIKNPDLRAHIIAFLRELNL